MLVRTQWLKISAIAAASEILPALIMDNIQKSRFYLLLARARLSMSGKDFKDKVNVFRGKRHSVKIQQDYSKANDTRVYTLS